LASRYARLPLAVMRSPREKTARRHPDRFQLEPVVHFQTPFGGPAVRALDGHREIRMRVDEVELDDDALHRHRAAAVVDAGKRMMRVERHGHRAETCPGDGHDGHPSPEHAATTRSASHRRDYDPGPPEGGPHTALLAWSGLN
jgi:hypothetical protein